MYGLFNFPGAGGNWQEIMTRFWSPNISVNFAGNAAIEREVNEDVASYGRQIGWLNEVVLALCAETPIESATQPGEALQKMQAAQKRIEAIKARRKGDALEHARDALKSLQDEDASAYRHLLRSLERDLPASSG
jgi:hypothetical protein